MHFHFNGAELRHKHAGVDVTEQAFAKEFTRIVGETKTFAARSVKEFEIWLCA
jgi:hypothetical protein